MNTAIALPPPTAAPAISRHFDRLERELCDLDFYQVTPTEADVTVYRNNDIDAARGASATVDVILDRRPGLAIATILPGGDNPSGPRITLTHQVPAVTQIVAFYGAINLDPIGAVESIAVAYQVRPWTDGAALNR